jgi:enoyl-CoA hydratase/carnithine racemase
MSEARVEIDRHDDGVAVVRMVRTDKHNALDAAMFTALDGAVDDLKDDRSLRAVVLCGDGPSFCSGIDIGSFASPDTSISIDDLLARGDGRLTNLAQRAAIGWAEVPVPVIAAVHGNCFGGGMQIALGADLRIAAPDAKLSVLEIRWGLIPDMGITRTLTRLVGIDVAKELTWTGRMLSGEEAAQLGVATRVADDPRAAALDLARDIAGRSPDAVRFAKRLYDESWTAPAADTLRLESELQVRLMGSPNQIAAVQAAMTKQPGAFVDPE